MSDHESDDSGDPADHLMKRGEFLRKLREMELQDEAERQATHEVSQNDDGNDDECVVFSNGDRLLRYELFLEHQRYYDDLKHVDFKYMDFGCLGTDTPLIVEQDKTLGKGGLCWDAAYILGEYVIRA